MEYHLPVRRDCAPIEVHQLEERDALACPIQSKGIGERSIFEAGAAVLNAIHNVTGLRVRGYPATLDRILPGLPA